MKTPQVTRAVGAVSTEQKQGSMCDSQKLTSSRAETQPPASPALRAEVPIDIHAKVFRQHQPAQMSQFQRPREAQEGPGAAEGQPPGEPCWAI